MRADHSFARGVGSLAGSIFSAGLLGQLNGITAFLSNDIIARAVVFAFVIVVIMTRPRGLFAPRTR